MVFLRYSDECNINEGAITTYLQRTSKINWLITFFPIKMLFLTVNPSPLIQSTASQLLYTLGWPWFHFGKWRLLAKECYFVNLFSEMIAISEMMEIHAIIHKRDDGFVLKRWNFDELKAKRNVTIIRHPRVFKLL